MDVVDLVARRGFEIPRNMAVGYPWPLERPVYLVNVLRSEAMASWLVLHDLLAPVGYWPIVGWDRFQTLDISAPRSTDIVSEALRLDIHSWFQQEGIERAVDEQREKLELRSQHAPFSYHIYTRVFPSTPAGSAPIAFIPVDTSWKALAFINNTYDNPPQVLNVAIMKYWHERWGAEVVAAGAGEIEVRVMRPPETYSAAFELAKEQYTYCPDLVFQETGSLRELARLLLGSGLWWFWWD